MNPSGNEQFIHGNFKMDRRPPGGFRREVVPFADGDISKLADITGPADLVLEATNDGGELAPWFVDEWWVDLIERFAEHPITIVIAPTQASLVNADVLHYMEMLHRVTPNWRLIAFAFPGDLRSLDDIELIARSPYHEVRFIDSMRPGVKKDERMTTDLPLEELFGGIRRTQAEVNAKRPVLVRLPAKAADVFGLWPSQSAFADRRSAPIGRTYA